MLASLHELIIEPLSYSFMQKALMTGLIVAIVCAILSCYLVLRGWALMGDAISHAVLPGIILAFVVGIPLAIGAFIAGLCCALFTGYLKDNSRIKEDTVMGIVFSGMFALGIVLFLKVKSEQHLDHILFGNILGIRDIEFLQTVIISLFVIIIMLLKRKDFLLYCFDQSHTRVAGLNVKVLHYGLLTMLSLAIVGSIQAVGVILVVAMLITPGITAVTLSKNFDKMLMIAISSSMLSSFLGIIVSFHIDADTAPCIVLIQSTFFILAVIYKKITNKIKPKLDSSSDIQQLDIAKT